MVSWTRKNDPTTGSGPGGYFRARLRRAIRVRAPSPPPISRTVAGSGVGFPASAGTTKVTMAIPTCSKRTASFFIVNFSIITVTPVCLQAYKSRYHIRFRTKSEIRGYLIKNTIFTLHGRRSLYFAPAPENLRDGHVAAQQRAEATSRIVGGR